MFSFLKKEPKATMVITDVKVNEEVLKKAITPELKAPDWKDLTVMEVLNIFDPAENDEDTKRAKLAEDLEREFRYTKFAQKLEIEELKSALIKAGIPLLDNKAVEKYKSDMVKFKKKEAKDQGRDEDWKWHWQDITKYNQDIPEAILKTALRVKQAVSNAGIEDATVGILELMNDEDPFIFVERKLDSHTGGHMGNGWHVNLENPFYFGVWNEKAFNGKYYLPVSKETTDIQSEIDDL